MTNAKEKDSPQPGPEPPMYLQRPSSAKSQDVSHILARTFRDLFMKETIGSDTVHYLTKSKGSDDQYHEKYVAALEKVQNERDRRFAEAAMLERHIMQAQARAMSADERALSRASSGVNNFPDLGLPPARSHFRSCLDNQLMKKHSLITADDLITEELYNVPAPQASPVPPYARETANSSRRKKEEDDRIHSPLPLGETANGLLSMESLSSVGVDQPAKASAQRSKVKELWREQMDAEDREQCRNGVANLHAKVNFLKNPRHIPPSASGPKMLVKSQKKKAKETGIKPQQDGDFAETAEEPDIFVPSPAEVVFTDYKIGEVYELTVELKNVSAVLRPVRVVPPKSVYFAVGLGQFPGEHGLVAGGMSCHYTIRFSPDSLADFDDVLIVQTQSSKALKVNLKGRRPPPVLSLPDTLDVGECLIGGTKLVRVTINNHGGRGRFCLVPRASWPVTNFKMSVSSSSINIQPFEVRPTTLEMQPGQSTIIEVVFCPIAEERYEESFTLICDNSQVRHFTVVGKGKTASVEISSMEGGLSDVLPGELSDVTAQHLVRFDTLNPFTYYQKSMVIKNKVNVDLMYNWQVVKPYIKPSQPDASESESVSTNLVVNDREVDQSSPFSIEPVEGILPANGTLEFKATFAPPMVSAFHSVLHMILKDIPSVSSGSEISRPSSSNFSGSDVAMPARSSDSIVTVQDLTVLEVEAKGECVPFSVVLQPYALYIPGQILINTQTKKTFRMINTSVSSIVFEWERYTDGYIIQVEPPMGELEAQSEYDFEVTVSSATPCKITHNLRCYVHHLEEPLTLHVEVDVKGPEVTIEETDCNFELVRLGTTVMRQFTIHNQSQVSAKWSVQESKDHMDPAKLVDILLKKEENDFKFIPSEGRLSPLDSTTVKVVYEPRQSQSLQTVFLVQVDGGNECAINVHGEVQSPEAFLKSCILAPAEVYLDVPVMQTVTLINKTLLSTSFSWLPAEGEQAKDTTIKMHPSEGQLGPREELEIVAEIQPHIVGKINQVRVPCKVAGMEDLLFLAIDCDVKGLSVGFSTPAPGSDIPSDKLLVDFGDVQLREIPTRTLILENKTGIAAPFSLVVENYFTKPPTPPGNRPGNLPANRSSQRRTLLGRTPNLADPLTKTTTKAQADIAKTMLQLNNGVAFTLLPDRGILQPFAKQSIEVQAFSDMWGAYEDTIIATVEGEEAVHIPIKMNVSGCPLNFQMVAANPDQKPIIRFGTHVSGVSPICRQMRINNISPVDIRLNWQVFTLDESDEQLLDLITTFGDAFPLCDEDGNEIAPPEEDIDSARTIEPEPSYLIPDSADTTPAVSRMPTEIPPNEESPRPNIISLFVREHGGKQTTLPYDIGPSPVVIPAHGNGFINVTFTPPSSENVNNATTCDAFALGYLSLDDKDLDIADKVSRKHGYLIEPIRLDMNAIVKPALLTIECAEDEGMIYRAAASDLVQYNEMAAERFHINSTTLSNKTQTALVFKLATQEPFFLVEPDSVTKQPTTQLLETEFTALKPQQSALVQVAFRITPEILDFANLLEREPEKEIENITLENSGKERKLKFTQNLDIEFNNGTKQTLPLEAIVTLPSLTISKENESLDFGVCYVGQKREMQLMLTNPTMSDSYWAVSVESKNEACDDTVFEIVPSGGKLDAFITHASNNKTVVNIGFTAKHTDVYEAVILFHGMLGEEPVRLSLRGEGSYDGKHEVEMAT